MIDKRLVGRPFQPADPAINAEIVRRREAGETYTVIAAALGMTKNQVIGRGQRAGARETFRNGRVPYIKRESRAVQDFPPHGFCVFSEQRQIPYHWCGKPTGSIDKPWCPEHTDLVFLPRPVKEAAD